VDVDVGWRLTYVSQTMSVVPACVKCLDALASTKSESSALMLELYNRFYTTLEKAKDAAKLDKGAVVRALFTLPLLCKDYDFETKGGLKVRRNLGLGFLVCFQTKDFSYWHCFPSFLCSKVCCHARGSPSSSSLCLNTTARRSEASHRLA
jgi:hypothetical protein